MCLIIRSCLVAQAWLKRAFIDMIDINADIKKKAEDLPIPERTNLVWKSIKDTQCASS